VGHCSTKATRYPALSTLVAASEVVSYMSGFRQSRNGMLAVGLFAVKWLDRWSALCLLPLLVRVGCSGQNDVDCSYASECSALECANWCFDSLQLYLCVN